VGNVTLVDKLQPNDHLLGEINAKLLAASCK
jgi:hypothetical protein